MTGLEIEDGVAFPDAARLFYKPVGHAAQLFNLGASKNALDRQITAVLVKVDLFQAQHRKILSGSSNA